MRISLAHILAPALVGLFLATPPARAQQNAALQESIQKTLDSTVAHVDEDLDRSITTAEEALEQSLKHGFKKQELRGYYCLGLAYYYKGYFRMSNGYYRNIVNDPQSEPKERSAAWNNLGVNYELLRQLDSSLHAYQESMTIDIGLGDKKSEHMVLINMGLLNSHLNRNDLAFEQTRQALDFFSKTGDEENMALCFLNFGTYYQELDPKRLDSALANNRRAEEIYRRRNDIPNLILTYHNQTDMWLQLGDYARALHCYRTAYALLPQIDSEYHEAALHAMASNVYMHTEDYDSAITHSKEAIRIYGEAGVAEYVVRETFFLAKVYAEAGMVPEFKKTIMLYDSLNTDLNTQELNNRLAEMEVMFKLDAKNVEISTGKTRMREQQTYIILISLCAMLLLLALIITYVLYARVKTANRSLYRKNIELMEREAAAEEPEAGTPQPHVEPENELLTKFRKVLADKELFKNPDLSLRIASQELGTNEKYLSQAINAGGEDNFNTFVNRFRINEARRIILEGGHNEIGMEELGLMVGFTNRHTFSRAFTQMAGISPSVFKKIHLSGRAGA